VLAVAAPVLLVLPLIVFGTELSRWQGFEWRRLAHNVAGYEIPRLVTALGAAWAAVLLLSRRSRALGVWTGVVAVLASASTLLSAASGYHGWWTRFGALGHGDAIDAAWGLATLAALACVPRTRRQPGPEPARTGLRRAAGWVPASVALVAGGAMLALAWMKIRAMQYYKCPDPWLDSNLAMTTAELWTGLLVVVPATRRSGLRFGILLMEGTAAFAARQWIDDVSSKGCGCFGMIDAPWSVHVVVAASLGLVMAVAYFRDLHIPAAPRSAAVPCAVARRGSPALLVRFRAIRRDRRVRGARPVWAAPAAAAALMAISLPTLMSAVDDALFAASDWEHADAARAAAVGAVGLAMFVVGKWLLRPRAAPPPAPATALSLRFRFCRPVARTVRSDG